MIDKWCQFNDWYVRLPDGAPLALNSEAAADYVLGLLARVAELEARVSKRAGTRRRKKQVSGDDDGDS